jgi:hypothetical protein
MSAVLISSGTWDTRMRTITGLMLESEDQFQGSSPGRR